LHDKFKSPIENVLDILQGIKRRIKKNERQYINDLNYVIRMITGNKLYEKPDYIQEHADMLDNKEVKAWVDEFS
jgi:hypothetical protein